MTLYINPSTLHDFRKDFAEAMASLSEKFDVTISIGNISYNENEFNTKMTVKNGRDPDAIARADFDRDVWRYEHLNLSEGMYNRIFLGRDGKIYALKGFNTRSPKYPLVVYRLEDGVTVRCPEGLIAKLKDEYYCGE